jgi:hypothetical protein
VKCKCKVVCYNPCSQYPYNYPYNNNKWILNSKWQCNNLECRKVPDVW